MHLGIAQRAFRGVGPAGRPVRDLRRGSLVDKDWRGRDPSALRAVGVSTPC